MFVALIFLLALAAVLSGFVLAKQGVRGLPVDDHPCCGKCGFDLIGRTDEAACPECGVGPEVPRTIGNRTRRPRRIAWGGALMAMGGLVIAAVLLRAASPTGYRSLLPLWALNAEAAAGDRAAIKELANRVGTSSLSIDDLYGITDQALEKRAVDSVAYRATWGHVIDAALATGRLDAGRQDRCYREAVCVRWWGTSERFKAKGSSGVLLVFSPAVGWSSGIGYDAAIELAEVDGRPVPFSSAAPRTYYHHVPNPAPLDEMWNVELPWMMAGKTLTIRWRVKIKDAKSGATLADDWVHTEEILVPASGDGFFSGVRARGDE